MFDEGDDWSQLQYSLRQDYRARLRKLRSLSEKKQAGTLLKQGQTAFKALRSSRKKLLKYFVLCVGLLCAVVGLASAYILYTYPLSSFARFLTALF